MGKRARDLGNTRGWVYQLSVCPSPTPVQGSPQAQETHGSSLGQTSGSAKRLHVNTGAKARLTMGVNSQGLLALRHMDGGREEGMGPNKAMVPSHFTRRMPFDSSSTTPSNPTFERSEPLKYLY